MGFFEMDDEINVAFLESVGFRRCVKIPGSWHWIRTLHINRYHKEGCIVVYDTSKKDNNVRVRLFSDNNGCYSSILTRLYSIDDRSTLISLVQTIKDSKTWDFLTTQ